VTRRRPSYRPPLWTTVTSTVLAAATVAVGWTIGVAGARAVLRRVVR